MEGVKTHMGIIDVFKGERNVIPKQEVKPFQVSQKQWQSSGDSRTNERRAEMERLTIPDKKIEGGVRRAFIDTKAVKENAMTIYWALKKYEDTGLTPEQIMELKERDKPRKIELSAGVPICPVCGRKVVKCYNFCPDCGQKLKQ